MLAWRRCSELSCSQKHKSSTPDTRLANAASKLPVLCRFEKLMHKSNQNDGSVCDRRYISLSVCKFHFIRTGIEMYQRAAQMLIFWFLRTTRLTSIRLVEWTKQIIRSELTHVYIAKTLRYFHQLIRPREIWQKFKILKIIMQNSSLDNDCKLLLSEALKT